MDVRFSGLEDSEQFDKTVVGISFRLGRKDEKDPYDELYISEDLAISHLLGDIFRLVGGKKWRWVKPPVVEKFQMTECPVGQMAHRVVQPRYAGSCEIEVES